MLGNVDIYLALHYFPSFLRRALIGLEMNSNTIDQEKLLFFCYLYFVFLLYWELNMTSSVD